MLILMQTIVYELQGSLMKLPFLKDGCFKIWNSPSEKNPKNIRLYEVYESRYNWNPDHDRSLVWSNIEPMCCKSPENDEEEA